MRRDPRISDWQGKVDDPAAVRTANERESRAQSRKRRQLRNAEWDKKLMPLYIVLTILVLVVSAAASFD